MVVGMDLILVDEDLDDDPVDDDHKGPCKKIHNQRSYGWDLFWPPATPQMNFIGLWRTLGSTYEGKGGCYWIQGVKSCLGGGYTRMQTCLCEVEQDSTFMRHPRYSQPFVLVHCLNDSVCPAQFHLNSIWKKTREISRRSRTSDPSMTFVKSTSYWVCANWAKD